jgi:hypothetical protein
MRADNVEVSWDNAKSKWMVRIQTGEEVIRRPSNLGKNADEQALRSAAEQALKDEGYELDSAVIVIRRQAS